jgi:hypothetical protein
MPHMKSMFLKLLPWSLDYLGGTLSVKFGMYMHQTTIFRRVLDNYPTYFFITLLLFNYLIYTY